MTRTEALLERAAANLAAFKDNPYPGRGVLASRIKGENQDEDFLVTASFVTARSPRSQNRRYKPLGHGRVDTELADSTKERGDPEKTIYTALAGDSGVYIASNGRHTDTLVELWGHEHAFYKTMLQHSYEDDEISTPRIIIVCVVNGKVPLLCEMAILRRSAVGDGCDRNFFRFEDLCPGIGYLLTTYQTDGNPPPIYEGEPMVLPISGKTAEEIAMFLWGLLDEANRVCLAVKLISLKTGLPIGDPFIINRF